MVYIQNKKNKDDIIHLSNQCVKLQCNILLDPMHIHPVRNTEAPKMPTPSFKGLYITSRSFLLILNQNLSSCNISLWELVFIPRDIWCKSDLPFSCPWHIEWQLLCPPGLPAPHYVTCISEKMTQRSAKIYQRIKRTRLSEVGWDSSRNSNTLESLPYVWNKERGIAHDRV